MAEEEWRRQLSSPAKRREAKDDMPAGFVTSCKPAQRLKRNGCGVRLRLPVPHRLTSPKRRDDVKMVGALVYKMLQSLERETGG